MPSPPNMTSTCILSTMTNQSESLRPDLVGEATLLPSSRLARRSRVSVQADPLESHRAADRLSCDLLVVRVDRQGSVAVDNARKQNRSEQRRLVGQLISLDRLLYGCIDRVEKEQKLLVKEYLQTNPRLYRGLAMKGNKEAARMDLYAPLNMDVKKRTPPGHVQDNTRVNLTGGVSRWNYVSDSNGSQCRPSNLDNTKQGKTDTCHQKYPNIYNAQRVNAMFQLNGMQMLSLDQSDKGNHGNGCTDGHTRNTSTSGKSVPLPASSFVNSEFGFRSERLHENAGMSLQKHFYDKKAVKKDFAKTAQRHIYMCQSPSMVGRGSRADTGVQGLKRTLRPRAQYDNAVCGAVSPGCDYHSVDAVHSCSITQKTKTNRPGEESSPQHKHLEFPLTLPSAKSSLCNKTASRAAARKSSPRAPLSLVCGGTAVNPNITSG